MLTNIGAYIGSVAGWLIYGLSSLGIFTPIAGQYGLPPCYPCDWSFNQLTKIKRQERKGQLENAIT